MDAENIKQRITQIEEEIRETPYHKATEHHIGRLKARLAKLKTLLERGSGGGDGGRQFAVKKTGDASVVLVGFPSVGKSTLLNKLANTKSKTAEYPFSTVEVIPGMMEYKGAKIQILDIPGLISGAAEGKGRGKQILSAVRGADLVMMMASIEEPETLVVIDDELEVANIRLNQARPQILINKRNKGGLKVIKGGFETPSKAVIEGICREYHLVNEEIIFKEDADEDDLIDILAGNRVYLPAIKVINKIDKLSKLEVGALKNFLGKEVVFISASEEIGLENLKLEIWEKLSLIRIYLTEKKNKMAADFEEPLIIKRGLNVLQAAEKISSRLKGEVMKAVVWGKSASFPGQKVSLRHVLEDGDVVYWVK